MTAREPYGVLLCTLLDRRSSVPLTDARVTCVIGRRIVQLDTDARGDFRAEFPQGIYDLVISARGELSLTLRGIGVLAGHTQRLTRAIIPGEDEGNDGAAASAIGGYLVDRLNHPVPDAAVTASAKDGRHVYTTRSDKGGAYVIHAIQPGEYELVIRSATRTLSQQPLTFPAERAFRRHDQRLLVVI